MNEEQTRIWIQNNANLDGQTENDALLWFCACQQAAEDNGFRDLKDDAYLLINPNAPLTIEEYFRHNSVGVPDLKHHFG